MNYTDSYFFSYQSNTRAQEYTHIFLKFPFPVQQVVVLLVQPPTHAPTPRRKWGGGWWDATQGQKHTWAGSIVQLKKTSVSRHLWSATKYSWSSSAQIAIENTLGQNHSLLITYSITLLPNLGLLPWKTIHVCTHPHRGLSHVLLGAPMSSGSNIKTLKKKI